MLNSIHEDSEESNYDSRNMIVHRQNLTYSLFIRFISSSFLLHRHVILAAGLYQIGHCLFMLVARRTVSGLQANDELAGSDYMSGVLPFH